jgi:hypothetical protein
MTKGGAVLRYQVHRHLSHQGNKGLSLRTMLLMMNKKWGEERKGGIEEPDAEEDIDCANRNM